MSVTGVGNHVSYVTPTQAVPSVARPVAATSTSLSTDTINFALTGDSETTEQSNALSLFSVLNANILDYRNLSGVGSAIDTYTESLAKSNVYDSSYTAPTAAFLHDLATVKSAAAAGDEAGASSALAVAKLDAPDNVAGGVALAKAKGDTAGETGLLVEGTHNIRDFLGTQGYSALAANTEADAIFINGLTANTTLTPASAQTRFQQISDLAFYAAEHTTPTKPGAIPSSSDPQSNILSNLLNATSGSEDLAALHDKYINDTISGEPRRISTFAAPPR